MLLALQVLIGLLMLLLVAWVALAWVTLALLRRGREGFEPAETDAFEAPAFAEPGRWAEANGFNRAGIYRIGKHQVGHWQDDHGRTLSVTDPPSGAVVDFSSLFDIHADGSLCTHNTRSNPVLPPAPGQWVQWFPGLELPRLWQHHREAEAEAALAEAQGLRPIRDSRPHTEQVAASLERLRAQARALGLGDMLGWWSRVRASAHQPIAPTSDDQRSALIAGAATDAPRLTSSTHPGMLGE